MNLLFNFKTLFYEFTYKLQLKVTNKLNIKLN